MIQVGLLTEEQIDVIKGKEFAPDSYFNPIQDYYDNWIISQEEMCSCVVEEYNFVKDLPLIDYVPKKEEE